MLKKSVINSSGQSWKLGAALLALLVGSFGPLYVDSGLSWTAGTILAVLGYGFGLITIRCISCGNRWLWEAAKDAGLYSKIFGHSSCLNCGHEFHQK